MRTAIRLVGSALLTFALGGAAAASDFDIVINEICYNPFTGNEDDEFVELHNAGSTCVDLTDWWFSEGISFVFPSGTGLEPGDYLLVSPNPTRTISHYGVERVLGPYKGRLDNGGEIVALTSREGILIQRLRYSDGGEWPSRPDGLGPTLELINPASPTDEQQNWGASLVLEGTPGRPNSRLSHALPLDGSPDVPRTVVINEVRPSESSAVGSIELYNKGAAPEDLSGFFLVDSRGYDFRIPAGTVLDSGNFLVLDENQLGFQPVLSQARYALVRDDGETWVDALNPHPAPAGASFGRAPDGDEDSFVLPSPSPGGPNGVVLQSAVVINEILYHPVVVPPSGDCVEGCSDGDQWVELHNRGASAVDVGGWSLSSAVQMTFPAGTTIPAGGYLVIAADLARFQALYPSVPPAMVLGGWTKTLGRHSDTINLNDALGNRLDHVEYSNGDPVNDESPQDGVDDRTLSSSDWPAAANDGVQGRSLELVNPASDNRAGAAWKAGPPLGTPGARNSVYSAAPPPLAWDVENEPAVPRSTDPVVVTCRASSLSPLSSVELLWHVDPGGPVQTVALRDDGLSGDKKAGDGTYGGSVPPQAAGTIVAFQIRVRADDGQSTTIPRSPAAAPYTGFVGPYFLWQVESEPAPSNIALTYRVVMTSADHSQLMSRPLTSDVLLPCTFIGGGKAHHTVGIRVRGKSSRSYDPHPWRINLPPERRFQGLERVNLCPNSRETEFLSADLFRRAGMPYSQEWPVNLIFQGSQHLYIYKEALDRVFRDRYFGGSSSGNLYRAYYTPGPGVGDLRYYGPTVNAQYRTAYVKKSNQEEDDYSDVIELCRAFDPTETPPAEFASRLSALIDPSEWAMYFAVQSVISNVDGGIQSNNGEDYLLYRVPAASNRPDAGKILILPWDIAETFTNANEQLFRPQLPAIRRFLLDPAFTPLYYAKLRELKDGAFARSEMRKCAYLLRGLFTDSRIDALVDTYPAQRNLFYENHISLDFRAGAAPLPPKVLVEVGETWRYFKGTQEPSGGSADWTLPGFDATAWPAGPTGIGYGDGDDATVLSDMVNSYTSVYARKTFTVADPAAVSTLFLEVDYDDGFVAYLNGVEVARRNVGGTPGTLVAHDAVASASKEAGTPETIDISGHRTDLIAGTNVLAAVVLNSTIGSSDLSFIPRLYSSGGASVGGGCGNTLFTTTDEIGLSGTFDVSRARVVTVDGAPATLDPVSGAWQGSASGLGAGANTVTVRAYDEAGAGGYVVGSLELTVIRLQGGFVPASGALSADTTWTAAAGPYHLVADVRVPAGITLRIEPGTVVLAEGGASLLVAGRIEADGTAESPILFLPVSCDEPWGGIAFQSTGILSGSPLQVLRGCDLGFGTAPGGATSLISAVASKVVIEGTSIHDLSTSALEARDARVEVRGSIVERTRGAIRSTASTLIVEESTFRDMGGYQTFVDLSSQGAERSLIRGSILEGGLDDGIHLSAASADIVDTTIRSMENSGILVEGTATLGSPVVSGCIVAACGTGLSLRNGGTVGSGDHDTIVENAVGIRLYMPSGGSDGGHATLDSTILWDNGVGIAADSNSTVGIDHSDTGEPWAGAGNISIDPLFMGQLRGDYSLAPASPAIGTGRDGSDMGAVPFAGNKVTFLRGDADANEVLELADAIVALGVLFLGDVGPSCLDRLDTNDDGELDVTDPVVTLLYLFGGGSAPPPPFPAPGRDLTPDALPCE